ncbi:tetratricopeptide repeat protein [Limibacter armeniacum]|uniref:tetratricopeptide repeat protein n=1 Tax=Limibacter armeniacum TaxID=466084 RepID=UPI002FE6BCAC
MRDLSLLTFTFRFVNENGKADSLLPKLGSVNDKQLNLGKGIVYYEDIYQVNRYQNYVIISLYPFATISSSLAGKVMDGHHSIVIKTFSFARELEGMIDRKLGKMRIHEKKEKDPTHHGSSLLKTQCPNCHTPIDTDGLHPSYYLYCQHCSTIFNKHGYAASRGDRYNICPETGYFDRIANYRAYKMYMLPKETAFETIKYYCSDTMEKMMFEAYFKKNLTLLVGSILIGIQHLFASRNRDPDFEELSKANFLAEKGNMSDARDVYAKMISRLPYHPGIYYNIGLAYLKGKNYQKALQYFEKSLDGCSNYQPTKDILKKYKNHPMSEL